MDRTARDQGEQPVSEAVDDQGLLDPAASEAELEQAVILAGGQLSIAEARQYTQHPNAGPRLLARIALLGVAAHQDARSLRRHAGLDIVSIVDVVADAGDIGRAISLMVVGWNMGVDGLAACAVILITSEATSSGATGAGQ